jgi:hypothetical protein
MAGMAIKKWSWSDRIFDVLDGIGESGEILSQSGGLRPLAG